MMKSELCLPVAEAIAVTSLTVCTNAVISDTHGVNKSLSQIPAERCGISTALQNRNLQASLFCLSLVFRVPLHHC